MSALLPMSRQDGELHPIVCLGLRSTERLVVVVGVWLFHRSLKQFQEGRYLIHWLLPVLASSTEPACTLSLERTHAPWHFFVGGILYVPSGHRLLHITPDIYAVYEIKHGNCDLDTASWFVDFCPQTMECKWRLFYNSLFCSISSLTFAWKIVFIQLWS